MNEGDIRVVRGTIISWDGEREVPIPGLMVQIAMPDSNKDGWLLVTNHWENWMPLMDLPELYPSRCFELSPKYIDLARKVRAHYEATGVVLPH